VCALNHCCSWKEMCISYSMCVFVTLLSSMQCACAVLYWHLWPLWLHNIFPLYLIKGMIFEKKLLWFSVKILSETFVILTGIQQVIIIHVHTSSHDLSVILVRFLMNLDLFQHILEKCSNINFHVNPSSGSCVSPCGHIYRHGKANGHFSRFCECD
jgi:hypothetical protein